jgi:hypothetical protein
MSGDVTEKLLKMSASGRHFKLRSNRFARNFTEILSDSICKVLYTGNEPLVGVPITVLAPPTRTNARKCPVYHPLSNSSYNCDNSI